MKKATNLNVRTSAGQLDEWKRLAGEDGLSLSAWVHARLNGSSSPQVPQAFAQVSVPEKRGSGEPVCEHRLPRGTWCKRCQTIRK